SAGLQQGEWVTGSVIARPNTASAMLLSPAANLCVSTLPMTSAEWQRYSCSAEYTGSAQSVYIYPRPGGQQLCIDILAAWLTKTSTPGRACWGGEAPVTCAADRHIVSTEGWPTEAGEVCVTVTLGEDAPSPAVILGRASSEGTALYYHIGRLWWATGSTTFPGPPLQLGQSYAICAGRSGGRLYVRVNGTYHGGPEAPALSWEPTAYLGGDGRVVSQA